MKTKIAIVGSRTFNDVKLLCDTLDTFITNEYGSFDKVMIVSGGARGADTIAEEYASCRSMPVIVHKAEWKKYGKAAGMIRNKDIVDDCDVLFAFWDGESKGAKNSIDLAKRKNRQVHVLGFTIPEPPIVKIDRNNG